MKLVIGLLSAAVIVATPVYHAFAADSMHSSTMMTPKCSTGDAMVSVDMKHKMYRPVDKSHMTMAASHTGSEMSSKGMMKTMCKSKADAMGAHMMKGKGQM